MEAIINSFLLVAATEMGDKTQLLALVLAVRFKKPWTIMAGIFVATIFNHLFAAWAGEAVAQFVSPVILKWVLALTFFVFAIWILIPDKDDSDQAKMMANPFLTTLILFFLAEVGDKTQLSTVALAAKYQNIWLVTFGTTLGMLFSDGLAVFFGEKLLRKISMKWVHIASSLIYVAFGIGILLQ
ncbi:TMEM165/GDT1 family protein [Bdellovibrio sp. HCB290]|uniref:TMEM165/GDT1 family protein n=1 Tax=Bdellovibrio sp. HCB290 TaxID=3394356 RepID=UPI0039B37EED